MRPERAGPYLTEGLKLATAGALALTLCACPPARPQSEFPDADAGLARMKATYACTVGLQGTAKVDLVTKKGRVKSSVDLFAINPESVRFDVLVPVVNTMLYTLTSDGTSFKLADFDQKVFSYGPASQCNLSRFTQVPVPPHALVSLLRGEAPILTHDKPGSRIRWDGSHYVLNLTSKNDASEEIHLGVVPEDVQKPWQEQRVRVLHVRVSQGGHDLYVADLEDHRKGKMASPRVDEDGIDDPIPPSGPQCEAELPYRIRFRVPGTKDDVVFDYKEATWNPPMVEGTFTQPKPQGIRDEFVDCR